MGSLSWFLEGRDDGVKLVQQSLAWVPDDAMLTLSHLGDARYIFTLIFPIVYSMSARIGLRLFRALLVAEFANLILKWIAAGDRPYWTDPTLIQYHLTCETGPGTPSGHAMCSAGSYGTLALHLAPITGLTPARLTGPPSTAVPPAVVWSLFGLFMALVAVSRLYVACHYLYQVVGGTLCGLAAAVLNLRHENRTHAATLGQHLAAGAVMAVFAVGVFHLLPHLGIDAAASIDKAKAGCNRPEWVNTHTKPFYVLWRDIGCAVGLGLAIALSPPADKSKDDDEKPPRLDTSAAVVAAPRTLAAVVVLRFLNDFSVGGSTAVEYPLALVKFALMPVVVVLANRVGKKNRSK